MTKHFCDRCEREAAVNPVTLRPELHRVSLSVDGHVTPETDCTSVEYCDRCVSSVAPHIKALLKTKG